MPFSLDDLEQALAQASIQKAVAPGTLPNLLLRTLASELAQWLWPQLEAWWTNQAPTIPQSWKDAWLCLVPNKMSVNLEMSDPLH